MSDQYRTIHGIVQFDPQEGEASGKAIRNIVVNSVGFGQYAVRVSATLWPSHKGFKVEKNDCVTLEGKYSKATKDKDGETVTYHNLSVVRAKNFGAVDAGTKPETDSNDVADETADEEIPF